MLKQKMRKIEPNFSNEPEFMKDVQTIIDENYINYLLFSLFETDKVYSVTEALFSFWPESWLGGPTAIKTIMSA